MYGKEQTFLTYIQSSSVETQSSSTAICVVGLDNLPVTVRCGKYKKLRETNPPESTPTIASRQLAENLPSEERKQSEINSDEKQTHHIASDIATIVDTKNWKWAWAATAEDIKVAGMYKYSDGENTTSEWTEEMIPLNMSSPYNQKVHSQGVEPLHDHKEEPPELEDNTNKAQNAEARMNIQGNHSNTDVDEHFKGWRNFSSSKTKKTFESTRIKETYDTHGNANAAEKFKESSEMQTDTAHGEPLSWVDDTRKTMHSEEETTLYVGKAVTELYQQSATTQDTMPLDDKFNDTSVNATLNSNETSSLVSATDNKQNSTRLKLKQAPSMQATPANDTSQVRKQRNQSHDLSKHDATSDQHTTNDVESLGDHNGMKTRPSLDPRKGFKPSDDLTQETMSSNDTRQKNTLLGDANKENGPLRDSNEEIRPLRDPNKENRPLQYANKENRPLRDPNKENRPLQDPNKENRSLRDPNKENRPLKDPNKENRPLQDPNKENRPLRDPNKENRPSIDPNKENRPLRDHNKENRPLKDANKNRPLQYVNKENRPLRDPMKENGPFNIPTQKTDH